LHDLGKYGDLFQARLRGEARGIDHWSAGAAEALRRYKHAGIAAALAVQGHHCGLQVAARDELARLDLRTLVDRLPQGVRLSDPNLDDLIRRFSADHGSLPRSLEVSGGSPLSDPAVSAMLDVRMLYSALVDADFLDTEAHFSGPCGTGRPPGLPLNPGVALDALASYIETVAACSPASTHMQQLRDDLREACLGAALLSPGLFNLTAPTGTGKTLSMLAFALRHAAQHGLRRIVTVIPYLTIIEQTVRTYREALAGVAADHPLDWYVLEDHSLSGTHDETGNRGAEDSKTALARDLLTENWDAPLVVTTSVQLLESLFANRARACRKLHRLANSVILFDEVQTLPARLAVPTLAALSRLAERYGCTVVFSTATQPAFGHLDHFLKPRFCSQGWSPRAIAPEALRLFPRSRRVAVEWPQGGAGKRWEELAEDLCACSQVLCIVNLKRHAWTVLDRLAARGAEGLLHLSTNMCPAHRRQVLDDVVRRLNPDRPLPCRLVSTQCVEAGVDVDFPIVYRAWGPLEAIAQAAGRCNRHGRLGTGQAHVFVPETDGAERLYPDDAYKQAADVAALVFAASGSKGLDINAPEVFEEYYRQVYQLRDPHDYEIDSRDPLISAIFRRDFPTVAREYRVIKQDAINVLVPFQQDAFETLAAEALNTGLTYSWIQRARPYSVSLFRSRAGRALSGHLEPIPLRSGAGSSEDWFIYRTADHYTWERGLVPPEGDAVLIA
jgi:CRISPR-associated endonuclease/helicase Cas3